MLRRNFLQSLAVGIGGSVLVRGFTYAGNRQVATKPFMKAVTPRGTARNLVFVLLDGGPSHVDTFDLKTVSVTPSTLGATTIGGVAWPAAILPQLSTRLDKVALVRSIVAEEAVHERAVYHLVTSHRHDASRTAEVPHFASAMSYLMASQRTPQDSLPTVVMFGPNPAANGFFPIEHKGLTLNEEGQIPNLAHPFESGNQRMQTLQALRNLQTGLTDRRKERVQIQQQAEQLMNDTELQAILGTQTQGEETDNGGDMYARSPFKAQCEAVVRLLEANKGTRIVQLNHQGWDHHDQIYSDFALPTLAKDLDEGLGYLIDTLAAKPGMNGKSLLDETLIVAAGEFGRTTGGLNESAGRDHYPYAMSALFAGGGVIGGRVIGGTDGTGSTVTDPGWSQPRFMGIHDLNATMYSALGLDWTQYFSDTPSGRIFELIPPNGTAQPLEIDTLFV